MGIYNQGNLYRIQGTAFAYFGRRNYNGIGMIYKPLFDHATEIRMPDNSMESEGANEVD